MKRQWRYNFAMVERPLHSTPPDRPTEELPSRTVGTIMSKRVISITMDDTIAKARELFLEFHFHHLLVLESGRLVGVISDRDLLKAVSPFIGSLSELDRDRATLNKRAHQIMSRNPITVEAGETVEIAAQRLLKNRVSCLPVVTQDGKVHGIISWRDLLKVYLPTPFQ
jgi:acetoin utilization protein AcuB